ncbi:MAG: hypothetical protein LBM27_01980 [Lactobacillaceae bacterium]|jgi:hypothetical protein|nr:hypothetical protein [Lactobacillaceae bacterium]
MITKYEIPININSSFWFSNASIYEENDDGSLHFESGYIDSGETIMRFSTIENTVASGRSGSFPYLYEGDTVEMIIDADFSENWKPSMRIEAFTPADKRVFEFSKEGTRIIFKTMQNNFRYDLHLTGIFTGYGSANLRKLTTTIWPKGEYPDD